MACFADKQPAFNSRMIASTSSRVKRTYLVCFAMVVTPVLRFRLRQVIYLTTRSIAQVQAFSSSLGYYFRYSTVAYVAYFSLVRLGARKATRA